MTESTARTLAKTFNMRLTEAGEIEYLDNSTRLAERQDAETSSDNAIRPHWFSVLLHASKVTYEKTGDLYHLYNVITLLEDGATTTPQRATTLCEMADVMRRKYPWLEAAEDPEKYIVWAAAAVAEILPNHPNAATFSDKLAGRAFDKYMRLGALDNLEQAIKRGQDALSATLTGSPGRAGRVGNLGAYIYQRYLKLGDLDDLEQAIKLDRDAVEATPLGHPNRSTGLGNLAVHIYQRYLKLGALEDLEQAIRLDEGVMEETPLGHPNRVHGLISMAYHLHSRYLQLEALDDLQQIIKLCGDAVAAAPTGDPNRLTGLINLAGYFYIRYERLGALDDLEQVTKLSGDAVAAAPLGHPDTANKLSNLAGQLHIRYERLGVLGDLEHVIRLGWDAVAVTPPGDSDRALRLRNLAVYFHSRYERLGTFGDHEQAIKLSGDAVAAVPLGHPSRASILSNLANYLYSRYYRLGALGDLEQAIKLGEDTMTATPPGHPDRAGRSINLATYLYHRYSRLEVLNDLERAIKLGRDAVVETPPSHPGRASRLNNLSAYLNCRYVQSGALDDLEQAAKCIKDAVAEIPPSNFGRATSLGNLAASFYSRFNKLGFLDDLEQAIKHGEDSVAVSASDHPDQALRWGSLARYIYSKFLQTHSDEDYSYILRAYREAWNCKLSRPRDRIDGAFEAGKILAIAQDWQESRSLLEGAVEMLPKVTSLRLVERDDQEDILSKFTQLAAQAASVALQAGGEVSHCLRLLELGRGIIMGLAIDCRSDPSELQVKDPDLFDKFNRLRTEIDSPLVKTPLAEAQEGSYEPTTEKNRLKRLQAIGELEEKLDYIRKLPGFEGFQLPPSSEELMAIAVEGPIVIFNSTQYRSDAIIVTNSAIKALALPALIYNDVTERMRHLSQDLTRGTRSTYPQRNEKMEKLLLWLWNTAVEPVFKELGLDTTAGDSEFDDSNLTRIWWIGVGPLATAPFHAAGDYSPGSERRIGTMDRVISSYIPTLKALSYARQKRLELLSRPDSRLLLVTMSTTPGQTNLNGAAREVEGIATTIAEKTTSTSTRLDSPGADEVLGELPLYHAIHFACHGISDPKNPSNSHLLLRKGDSVDKLTVGAISNTNIKSAQLAYLSACCTAENSSVDLADESIHIASGFQLAGFSHVLATMWKSNDIACRQVSGDFYRSLFDGQGSKDHRKVSAAFHNAVKKLRDQNLEQPIKWASFIHTGA